MNKGRRALLCAVLALAVGVGAWALLRTNEGSRGVLYRISTDRATVYLLGSIHVGSSDMYPFGETISQAMDASDTFVFECDSSSAEAVAQMRDRMQAEEGETLQAAVGVALYGELTQACEKIGVDVASFDGMKPWAVVNTLAVYATSAELGARSISQAMNYGVEKRVQAYVNQRGKPVRYLETLGEQIDALEGFSEPLTAYLLADECQTILHPESVRGMDASIAQWPQWWRTGDEQAFSSMYLSTYPDAEHEAESREYHQSLITERNERMAERLEAMMNEGGTYFVTVGLLHLVLPQDSVPALLSSRGYDVELVSRP